LAVDTNNAAEVALYDEDGDATVGIGAHSSANGLWVKDKESKTSISAMTRKGTGPEIALRFSDGRPGIGLQIVDGDPVIGLAANDGTGKPRLAIIVAKNGSSEIRILDKDQAVRASIGVAVDGRPAVAISDRNQMGRVGMGLEPGGAPELSFKDDQGRIRAAFSMGRDGRFAVLLLDANGKLVWQAP
jgi:hypothetical protein